MILNHKAAIEFLLESTTEAGFDRRITGLSSSNVVQDFSPSSIPNPTILKSSTPFQNGTSPANSRAPSATRSAWLWRLAADRLRSVSLRVVF